MNSTLMYSQATLKMILFPFNFLGNIFPHQSFLSTVLFWPWGYPTVLKIHWSREIILHFDFWFQLKHKCSPSPMEHHLRYWPGGLLWNATHLCKHASCPWSSVAYSTHMVRQLVFNTNLAVQITCMHGQITYLGKYSLHPS